jgi:hypothetical protein
MDELGTPMTATQVTKTEVDGRRVDADELLSLGVALDVSPVTLLLPPVSPAALDLSAPVDFAPGVSVSLGLAWEWATGERALSGEGAIFLAENHPHRFAPGSRPVSLDAEAQATWFAMTALVEQAVTERCVPPSLLRTAFEQALAGALQKAAAA